VAIDCRRGRRNNGRLKFGLIVAVSVWLRGGIILLNLGNDLQQRQLHSVSGFGCCFRAILSAFVLLIATIVGCVNPTSRACPGRCPVIAIGITSRPYQRANGWIKDEIGRASCSESGSN